MKHLLYLLFLVVATISCTLESSVKQKAIVQKSHIQNTLEILGNPTILTALRIEGDAEIDFWKNEIKRKGDFHIFNEKLGMLYAHKFEITGDLNYIHKSNAHYDKAVHQSKGEYKANMLLAMSSNFIKLHEFQKAQNVALKAFEITERKDLAAYMISDAAIELGAFDYADKLLLDHSDHQSFDYLVRYGKYSDRMGDLDTAIKSTELALQRLKSIEHSKKTWVKTHLADMYGHQGWLQKSYETYLQTIKENPFNLHALKGIAWIAYAHDKNYDLAFEIMENIHQSTALPDALLLMAEIAFEQGRQNEGHSFLQQFLDEVHDKGLAELYNSYVAELNMEKKEYQELALTQAMTESDKRPTPANYALLARVYSKMGNHAKAVEILENQVIGKSYEPKLIYESGLVMLESGNHAIGKKLLLDANEASFELGPSVSKDINARLKGIM